MKVDKCTKKLSKFRNSSQDEFGDMIFTVPLPSERLERLTAYSHQCQL